MTKARDIASAAPAPSTVSATEIGYLDGVSSAIQTQLDAKVAKSLVDAKGDLLVGSANDTVSRLAVSNDGETLVADSSTSTGLRYNPPVGSLANPVINGGFDIWQRGTSFSASSTYGSSFFADRWNMFFGTTTGFTISRQSVSDSTNLPNIQYAVRVQRANGTTGSTGGTIGQSIEIVNSIPLAGKAITLSFYARKGADYSGASSIMNASLKTGTGTTDANGIYNNYTGQSVVINNQQFTLTTSWQRFVATGTIGSTATQIALEFVGSHSGTSGTNDYWEVTGVQIDVGTYTASSAPTFRRSGGTLAGELAACQRYYWRNTGFQAAGGSQSAADNNVWFSLNTFNAVPMRATPTAAIESTPYIADFASNLRDVTSVNVVAKNIVGFAYSSTKLTTSLSFGLNFSDTGRALSFNAEL